MTTDPSPDISRALFSLAGGLEVAEGQRMLQAVGRAKVASILFDEIILESGLHIVEMSSTEVSMIRRQRAPTISTSLLRHSRSVERGMKAGLAIRRNQDHIDLYVGTNLPRLEDTQYFERDIAYRYVSEYHTGILDDLARLEADWVNVIEIIRDESGDTDVKACPLTELSAANIEDRPFDILHLDIQEAQRLGEILGETATEATGSSHRMQDKTTAMPDERMFAQDLSEALHVGHQLKATPALSTAFERVALERGVPIVLPGATSLGLVVPNFSLLPWEVIAQFRDHPGAIEARGRLREFETTASNNPPDSVEFTRETGRAVTQALLGVTKDLAPSLPNELRGPILGSAVSLIPIVGQYASLAVSMGDLIATLRSHEAFDQSWVAAILELRDASLETLIDF